MRDVNYGWLIRYIHMNGASFFFIVTYIHIFRGLYFGSYKEPRELLWMLGVVILLLMMATAFMGYVLPWGQMSYWGATVITNLFSAFPGVGGDIVTWLWGGFAVGNPTLNRFFALHYLLPFVIVGVVGLHLMALHQHGSNNPLGIDRKGPQDSIPFHPYYTIKDMFGLGVFLIIFAIFVFYMPNALGDPQNYIPANPLQTPPEIVPEWYFLPFYAILRSIPNKLLGVCAMFGSILTLFLLPWLDTSRVRSAFFRPIYKWVFWLLVIDCFVLGWVGAHRPEGMFVVIGRIATLYILLPLLRAVPAARQDRAAAAAADQHHRRRAGQTRRAGAAARPQPWRNRDAPRALALPPPPSSHSPRPGAGPGRGDPAAAQPELVLRRRLRHLRPRRAAARLPDLHRGLLELPFDESAALPRSRRARL